MPLVFEHLRPKAAGGPTRRENLWLSCYRCNEFKGTRTEAIDPESGECAPLFNPRRQRWIDHFEWSADGTHIVGLTTTGRATVEALRMNNDFIVTARRRWVAADGSPPAGI